MHLNVRFSTETELKKIQDFLYEKSGQGVSFTGLVEAMVNEVTIVTAVHNIKSNKGSKTAGVDKIKMDKYLQMPKDELMANLRGRKVGVPYLPTLPTPEGAAKQGFVKTMTEAGLL